MNICKFCKNYSDNKCAVVEYEQAYTCKYNPEIQDLFEPIENIQPAQIKKISKIRSSGTA